MTIVRGEMKNEIAKKIIVLGALALVVSLGVGAALKVNASKTSDISSDQERSIAELNDIRSSYGLSSLKWNEKLADTANFKANDILSRNYFDHVSPNGEMIWGTIEREGYKYRAAGENLAIDFTNVDDAYDAWLKSPSHLENIISNKYSDFGFGVAEGVYDGKKTKVYVQIFASPEPIYEQLFSNIGGENG